MARRYDSSTTTFSPEGRLHQVEYAIEAINNAGTCVGLQCSDCIILGSEKRAVSKLLAKQKVSDKTYKISEHLVVTVAGLSADASILINQCRLNAARHMYANGEAIPVEQVVSQVCDHKQAYTQYGGLRPFGVSFLFAGYDEHFGMQLFQTDPSGNYSGWKATVIGANNMAGKSFLKTEYAKDVTVGAPDQKEGLKLAVRTLNKTMDSTGNGADKYELFVLSYDEELGECRQRVLSDEETQRVLDEVLEEEKSLGDA